MQTDAGDIGPAFSIGSNYLVFLYGSNNVDWCSLIVEAPYIDSHSDVQILASRSDLSESNWAKKSAIFLLNHLNKGF